MFQLYSDFLTRARPETGHVTIEAVPNFYVDAALWGLFFSVAMIVTPMIIKRVNKQWYDALDDRKRRDMPSYIVSLIHHVRVVPVAWYFIYQDFTATSSAEVDYVYLLRTLAPFIFGFILADTLCYAIPEVFHAHYEYFVHHLLALGLMYPFLYGPGSVTRFYCHVVICETTNLLFNSAWVLRLAGFRDAKFVTLLEILFAAAFLILRVINLSLVFGIIFLSPEGRAFGLSRYVLPPICAMQWYWMARIVTVMRKKVGKLSSKREDKKE